MIKLVNSCMYTQTWKLAAFADIRVKEVATWALQPTGRTLLCTLVQHHAQHRDFQTVNTC